ncbi:MAG TPA: biopolymer transporter Tol [Puia sp.]
MKSVRLLPVVALSLCICQVSAQTAAVDVPDWALPGSSTHKQVPPPLDFHRPARTEKKAIGIFQGQSDVGSALAPGSSSYNASNGQYTIVSAGYNIWYQRDEFRYIWKKMSGDISLAADVAFPDTAGYNDRKAVLVIRQSLDDDSKEAVVALHGAGLMHLAWRPDKNQQMKEVRVNRKSGHTASNPGDSLDIGMAQRIGLEKNGDAFAVFVSMHGEPMHQVGSSIQLHIDGPFFVGLGFCSHLPAKKDAAILSSVVLENAAGRVR